MPLPIIKTLLSELERKPIREKPNKQVIIELKMIKLRNFFKD